MIRRSRSFFVAVFLVGLLSPITGLDDAMAAAIVPDLLATVYEPDADPACQNDHSTPLNADSILPPHSGLGATLVLLRQVPSSMGYGSPQCPGLFFRIPRAPPIS